MTETEILTMVLKNIQSMQSDIRHIKDEIQDMQYTMQGMQNDIADLQSTVRNVKGDVFNLQKNIVDLQNEETHTKEDVLKNTFTLESTINQCITLLGDGYRAASEKIDKLHIDSIISENNMLHTEINLIKTQLAFICNRLNMPQQSNFTQKKEEQALSDDT